VVGREDMTEHLLKIAIAQIAQEAGFQSCRRSALDTFAEVARRFVLELG